MHIQCQTKTFRRVLRVRLRDQRASLLSSWTREVNFVWNYCNDLSFRHWDRQRKFLSGYDLQRYLNGASKHGLAIPSKVFQQVAEEYATRRRQHKKVKLAWRKSGGGRRSLGWIPFKSGAVTWKSGQLIFNGVHFKCWDSYGLSQFQFRAGNFSEDSRGRWYLNIVVEEVSEVAVPTGDAIGIDLGLSTLATAASTNDSYKIEAHTFYRDL